MTSKNGAEAMQHLLIGIIAVILSCLFSLGGSWFVWGSQAVNRDEVKKIVNVHAPYVRDQKFLFETQKRNTENIKTLVEQTNRLVEVQAEMSTKMDMVLKQLYFPRDLTRPIVP